MVQCGMDKKDAIALLGGTVAAAAAAIGVSHQAIARWPERLPARIADRVQAAMFRRLQLVERKRGAYQKAGPASAEVE